MAIYSRLKQDYIKFFFCKHLCQCTLNLPLKFDAILPQTYKDMTLRVSAHVPKRVWQLASENFSIQKWPLYKSMLLEEYSECFFMFDAILKATNSSFQQGMTFYRSIHVTKVMKLLAFIFEQPS